MVRIVGQMILSGIFLGCYYFCLRGIDSEKASARFWKSAFLLLIPVSRAWLFLAMKAYYIPAVSVCFVTLGLALRICKKEKSVKSKGMLVIAGSVLAFVSSLEGTDICTIACGFFLDLVESAGTKKMEPSVRYSYGGIVSINLECSSLWGISGQYIDSE